MISEDENEEYERNISLAEYLASFWNAEAVQKIRASRESKDDDRFASNEEFEQQILSGSFKDNDFLNSLFKEGEENTNSNDNIRRGFRETRLPKDLSGMRKLCGDDQD